MVGKEDIKEETDSMCILTDLTVTPHHFHTSKLPFPNLPLVTQKICLLIYTSAWEMDLAKGKTTVMSNVPQKMGPDLAAQ